MTIHYNPHQPFKVLFTWKGTILPLVLSRLDTWLFLILHAGLVGCYMWDSEQYRLYCPVMPFTLVGPANTLLVFFAVFYNNHCFSRYMKIYDYCCVVNAKSAEFVSMLKLHINPSKQVRIWNAVRLMLASAYVHYYSMTDGTPIQEGEWEEIKSKQLLLDHEIEMVVNYKGNKSFLLQTWCMHVTKNLYTEEFQESRKRQILNAITAVKGRKYAEGLKLTETTNSAQYLAQMDTLKGCLTASASLRPATSLCPNEFNTIEKMVLEMRAACGAIVNELRNPLPFPYFHVLNMMMAVNYLMLAYCLVWFGSPFTIVAFTLFVLITTGLREVSACLSDPFGEDDVDFDVPEFLSSMFSNAIAFLNIKYVPDDRKVEKSLTAVTSLIMHVNGAKMKSQFMKLKSAESSLPTVTPFSANVDDADDMPPFPCT